MSGLPTSTLIWSLLLAPGAASSSFQTRDQGLPRFEAVTLRGKVVELTALLKSRGLPADPEPITKQVVLVEEGGATSPLLSDEASRALFLDARLREKKAELHVRRFPGLPYLQVLTIQIEDQGTLRTPEYYCEICTISVRYPQICPCCQGSMELRMKPVSKD